MFKEILMKTILDITRKSCWMEVKHKTLDLLWRSTLRLLLLQKAFDRLLSRLCL